MLIPPVSDTDHQEGPQDAPVTLVEFGDFECPYCGQSYTIIESIRTKMGDELRFAFRNFPLREIHPYAEDAAEASEAAAADGKFWEMYNKLFQNQDHLAIDDLVKYGEEIGMDSTKLREDLENHTYLPQVDQQSKSGDESGVEGTPTFFINGEMYQGPFDEDSFLAALQEKLSID